MCMVVVVVVRRLMGMIMHLRGRMCLCVVMCMVMCMVMRVVVGMRLRMNLNHRRRR